MTFTVFEGKRPLAMHNRAPAHEGAPTFVWLGGFRSEMIATKATTLDATCEEIGAGCLRFDYSGHGESPRLKDASPYIECSITEWIEDALAITAAHGGDNPVFVGSSMGGWIALHLTLARAEQGLSTKQLILIAPAPDFITELMWPRISEEARQTIEAGDVFWQPSDMTPEPYPITPRFVEEGKKQRLLHGAPWPLTLPIHILHGSSDEVVPLSHVQRLINHVPGAEVQLTLVNGGDHRLSREDDLALLSRVCAGVL
jgi:pimeloyl-ACP methyl ester carboxylesterase